MCTHVTTHMYTYLNFVHEFIQMSDYLRPRVSSPNSMVSPMPNINSWFFLKSAVGPGWAVPYKQPFIKSTCCMKVRTYFSVQHVFCCFGRAKGHQIIPNHLNSEWLSLSSSFSTISSVNHTEVLNIISDCSQFLYLLKI